MKMKILLFTVSGFLTGILATIDDNSEHVHFKIHVPEIINHHTHTRIVYIHVADKHPHPKPHPHHQEEDHADWNSYHYYNYKNGIDENGGGEHKVTRNRIRPVLPNSYHVQDSYLPYDYNYETDPTNSLQENNNDAPPYEINENVPEYPRHHTEYKEEGYHKGLHAELGHSIQEELKNFYDNYDHENDYAEEEVEDEGNQYYTDGKRYANYNKEIGYRDRAIRNKNENGHYVARMTLR